MKSWSGWGVQRARWDRVRRDRVRGKDAGDACMEGVGPTHPLRVAVRLG